MPDETCATGIHEAILPESAKPPSRRARVTLRVDGSVLLLDFEAEDIIALRASLNSYLRWARALRNSYETIRRGAAV